MKQYTRGQTICMTIVLAMIVIWFVVSFVHQNTDRHIYGRESGWEILFFDVGFHDDGVVDLRKMRDLEKQIQKREKELEQERKAGKKNPTPSPASR
ncbi:MAG: hypothetical protein AB7H86_05435 [Blastocatellales bacterium]